MSVTNAMTASCLSVTAAGGLPLNLGDLFQMSCWESCALQSSKLRSTKTSSPIARSLLGGVVQEQL